MLTIRCLVVSLTLAVLAVPGVSVATPRTPHHPPAPSVSVFATGFNAPRGLAFDSRGRLYVAEAGSGGTDTTEGGDHRREAIDEGGAGAGWADSRDARGGTIHHRSTTGLGDLQLRADFDRGDPIGVADVAFVGGRLYALIAGGGCSNGNRDPNRPNGIIRVDRNGSWRYVANLSRHYLANPIAEPDPEDYVPDGVPYGMVARGEKLFVIEANSGVLDRVSVRTGSIRRVADISATRGNIVPTAIARDGKSLYVGNLGQFPIEPGTQSVFRVKRDGTLQTVASGFTAILGIAFDRRHRMYVLETSTVGPYPEAGRGRVVRVSPRGTKTTIADGLTLPHRHHVRSGRGAIRLRQRLLLRRW